MKAAENRMKKQQQAPLVDEETDFDYVDVDQENWGGTNSADSPLNGDISTEHQKRPSAFP